MGRTVLQRLVVWIAFATTLLVPFAVRAAIVPTCENIEVPSVSPVEPSFLFVNTGDAADTVDSACNAAVADDGDGDTKVAAMCDARGASVVAPPRILPIVDARIDAARSCDGSQVTTPVIGPAPHDAPWAGSPLALIDHAVLGADALVPPAPSELGPSFPPVTGAERPGALRELERPPC